MLKFRKTLCVAALLGVGVGCGSSTPAPSPLPSPPKPPTFTWPIASGFRGETIPFPLDFAPNLAYRGTEELRFAPGFFDPKAPGYFSYSFVWWVNAGPAFEPKSIEGNLKEYFVGLTKAVAKGKFEPDLTRIEAQIAPDLTGEVRTIDAFKTHGEVILHVAGKWGVCGINRYLLVTASPKPLNDPMWASLTDTAAAFHCD